VDNFEKVAAESARTSALVGARQNLVLISTDVIPPAHISHVLRFLLLSAPFDNVHNRYQHYWKTFHYRPTCEEEARPLPYWYVFLTPFHCIHE
jgi:hypothetical protein